MKHSAGDQDAKRRRAFARGFWRGLASPLALYSSLILPASAQPTFSRLDNPAARSDGLRGDWKRVGQYLREATEHEAHRHG